MRLSLIDVIVFLTCLITGQVVVFATIFVLNNLGLPIEFAMTFGIAVGLIYLICLPAFIYRHARFIPLFLPRCPTCRTRPDAFEIQKPAGHKCLATCSACQSPFEIWWRTPRHDEAYGACPAVRLCWPEWLGIWKVVQPSGDTHVAKVSGTKPLPVTGSKDTLARKP